MRRIMARRRTNSSLLVMLALATSLAVVSLGCGHMGRKYTAFRVTSVPGGASVEALIDNTISGGKFSPASLGKTPTGVEVIHFAFGAPLAGDTKVGVRASLTGYESVELFFGPDDWYGSAAEARKHVRDIRVDFQKPEPAETVPDAVFTGTIHEAAKRGDLEVVTGLLEQGADPDAKDGDGVTALMHASESGHPAVVGILLQQGADPDLRESGYGMTALMVSSAEGHTEAVRLLVEAEADVNLKDKNLGATALLGAAEYGHTEVIRLLLAKGAEVNVADKRGFRALAVAATNGHLGTVELLIANEASINAQDDKYGATPLMGAAANGHHSVAELLLKHGADTTRKAKNGSTALDFARQKGHTRVAALIKSRR
jgi:ankyrin repeat protein